MIDFNVTNIEGYRERQTERDRERQKKTDTQRGRGGQKIRERE